MITEVREFIAVAPTEGGGGRWRAVPLDTGDAIPDTLRELGYDPRRGAVLACACGGCRDVAIFCKRRADGTEVGLLMRSTGNMVLVYPDLDPPTMWRELAG